jgi:hypothetical protein
MLWSVHDFTDVNVFKCNINIKLSGVSDLGVLLSVFRPIGIYLATLHLL